MMFTKVDNNEDIKEAMLLEKSSKNASNRGVKHSVFLITLTFEVRQTND